MVSRLVLGCGTTSTLVVESLAELPGDLRVVCRDEDRVETLRGEGVRATTGDPTDPETVLGVDGDAELVYVGTDDAETNRSILTTARETLPDAEIVAYLGEAAPPDVAADVRAGADGVVDPGGAVADRIVDAVSSETATRCRRLRTAIRDLSGPLAVVMHDNPDPDAIASAVALVRIAATFGVPAVPCYYGEIAHQENRALVNLLELDLRELSVGDDLSEFGGFALVDHAQPGVNDGLPEDVYPDVVIDHHPPRVPVEARFADLRSDVGGTSTLLTTYMDALDVPLDRTVATALLYGIRVDTDDFSRQLSPEDFLAAATLWPHVDAGVLDRVESPSVDAETIDVLARAIQRRFVRENVLVSYVGAIGNRDALSQAADRMLSIEGIDTALVYGRMDGTAYLSARSRGDDLDLGETLRTAFGQIGSAGGHAGMAGAQIPIGIIGDLETERDEDAAVQDVVTDRFFEAISDHPVNLSIPFWAEIDRGAFRDRPDGM